MRDKNLIIAMVAHMINKAYCESIGDMSQPAWEDAPAWQIASVVNGVKLHIKNPNTTPEQSHESWLQEKAADGWAYGETKDLDKKLHPCFVPYNELPESQRTKDHLFSAVVTALSKILYNHA